MNGILPLRGFWGRNFYTVYGGPYMEKPEGMYGVKVAKEIALPSYFKVDIVDYATPRYSQINRVLPLVVSAIIDGKALYVGCMGGRGRTGLFLALLAKAWGLPNPVQYVRDQYYKHAVETNKQMLFVDQYCVAPAIKRKVFWAKTCTVFQRGNLTPYPL